MAQTHANGAWAAEEIRAGAIRADPVLMAHTAAGMLTASGVLVEDSRQSLLALDVPEPAYGCTAAARVLARAHEVTVGEVRATVERLAAVLEGDADRLYRIAFAWQEAEESAARRTRRAGHREPDAVAGMVRPVGR